MKKYIFRDLLKKIWLGTHICPTKTFLQNQTECRNSFLNLINLQFLLQKYDFSSSLFLRFLQKHKLALLKSPPEVLAPSFNMNTRRLDILSLFVKTSKTFFTVILKTNNNLSCKQYTSIWNSTVINTYSQVKMHKP